MRGALKDRLFFVNDRYEEIDGRKSYKSIAAVPEAIDCAVIAVPSAAVLDSVESCAEAGVKGAIVYASGFGESSREDGARLQRQLTELAHERDIRVVGPNCVGLTNLVDDVELQFLPPFHDQRVLGGVAVVSQSGALGYICLQSQMRGAGFTYGLMPGNSCDVDAIDFVNYLIDDESTRAIILVMEGLRDGDALRFVAQRARQAGKPIIAHKMGAGATSAAAALSHTGSMVGSRAAFEAAFQQYGIVALDDFESLVETAQFFAKNSHLSVKADGVGILCGSGGGGVLAAESAEREGFDLPQPTASTKEVLSRYVPDYGSTANPADLTADLQRDPGAYKTCLKAFSDDPQYGAVVHPQTVSGEWLVGGRVQAMSDAAREMGVPLAVIWLSGWLEGPGSHDIESDERLSLFRSPSTCFGAIRRWIWWKRWLEQPNPFLRDPALADESNAVPELIDEMLKRRRSLESGGALDEFESKRLLELVKIPVPAKLVAGSAAEAAAAASELGGKVVVKILSAEITHKADVGGVLLDIRGSDQAAEAFETIRARLGGPSQTVSVLVEEQVPDGRELIVGARRDEHFGAIVVLGPGGSGVEERPELISAVLPLTNDLIEKLVDRIPGHPVPANARRQLTGVIRAVADLITAVTRIAEVEINPLVIEDDGHVKALDGLVILRGELSA